MSTENIGRMLTPEARLLNPYLLKARTKDHKQRPLTTPRYEAELVFDPTSIEEMKQEAIKVAHAKWPGRDLKGLKFPFKKGDVQNQRREETGKKARPAVAGKILMNVKSAERFPPQVVDHHGDPIIDDRQIYSGCYGHAAIKFEAYDGNGEEIKDGVTVYIDAFMKLRDGERVGGRDMKQVFAGVLSRQTQEDPTEGLDDEIVA